MDNPESSTENTNVTENRSLLASPIWQFWAVVLAIIAIILTLIITFSSRTYKGLRVEILSNSPLISVNSEVGSELQLLFREQPVESVTLVLLKLENTGNLPITETDYSEPISISFSQGAEVGDISVQETSPQGIPLQVTVVDDNKVVLSKVLLNPDDQAVLRILVLNNDATIQIDGRIAGITELETAASLQDNQRATVDLVGNIFVAFLLFTFVISPILIVITNTNWYIKWRKGRGYNPLDSSYKAARSFALKGDVDRAVAILREIDRKHQNYIGKARTDPDFSYIWNAPDFISLMDAFEYRTMRSKQETETNPTNQV